MADFDEVDVDDTVVGEDLRQRATREWEIAIQEDTAGEPAEKFSVTLASISGGANPTAANITVEPDDPAALEVTIGASDLPVVSVTTASTDIIEGTAIIYTVTRSETTTQALDVNIVVTETSTLTAPGETGSRTVTIDAGQPSTVFAVDTSTTDTTWDEHGTVTAAVAAGDGYTAGDTQRSATRNVKDNDFPLASLSLLGIPDPVEEGHATAIEYLFVTDADEQPHKSTGEFTFWITGDTATVGPPGPGVDVTQFQPVVFSVDPGAFTPVDIDDGPGRGPALARHGRNRTRPHRGRRQRRGRGRRVHHHARETDHQAVVEPR